MIITFSGYDGVGKSTNVNLLIHNICEKYNLKGVTIYDVNNNSEVYEDIHDLDQIYLKLKEFDVIGSRFYMRSKLMNKLQNGIIFGKKDIFNDNNLVKTVSKRAKYEADLWFDKVIKKLLKNGKIVIFDRYWYDEVAYRSLYGIEKHYIENLYKGYLEPDFKIFLDTDLDTIRNRNKNRIDEKTTLFSNKEKMEELYLNLGYIKNTYDMCVINVTEKSIDVVGNEIFELVDNTLCNCYMRSK